MYVAMSKAVHAAYLAEGVPPQRLRLAYDGAEIPERPTRRDGVPRAMRVGTLGRLVAWKGLATVVEAASLVVREFPGARFEIVGNDDPSEPGFRAELLREIERRGLSGSVAVQDFAADPSAFVASIDCLVNPSFPAEPFGMSIVEAMADACPVIATHSGGPAEIIEDGRSGLLVPPEDPAALAAAILRLAQDSDYRRTMGEEARRRVAALFEVGAKVAEQEALLMTLAR
jgi:glycosyltransferase involved in cell wall biosynthesis